MVINGAKLLELAPIKNMIGTKEKINGTSYGLSEAGYDIRIKQDIRFFPAKYHLIGSLIRQAEYSIYIKSEHHPDFIPLLKNGNFCIASAIEEFEMPTNLVGIVHDKSTWARKGLSVFNTVIEPGWNGFLTLELVYHGDEDLVIPAGSGIAQVIFHELSVSASYGNGKYQNQEDKPVPSKES